MNTDNSTKQWAIIGGVALIVLALGGWVIMRSRAVSPVIKGSMATTTGEQAAAGENEFEGAGPVAEDGGSRTVTVQGSGERVSVADQAAGSSVAVSGVSVPKISWIAVRDVRAERILGARRVAPGASETDVVLLKPTVAGTLYRVVVYVDDGDMAFDMHKDALVEGIGSEFTAK